MRPFFLAAILLTLVLPAAAQRTRGSLIIVGGGSQPAAVRERFVQLAGGQERAHILVIPLAAADPVRAAPGSVEAFTRLGVRAASLVLTPEQADADTIGRVLRGITGVCFQAACKPVSPTRCAARAFTGP